MKAKGSQLSKGNYIALGKAVAKFNRTINELKQEENKLYLPNEINYQEFSKRITTKEEFERQINNLKSFSKSDDEIYETTAGEELTFWEREILEDESKRAIRRMKNDLSRNVNKYDKDTIDTLKSNIKTIKELEHLKGRDFVDAVKKIHRLGAKDYNYRRALQYRENFMKAYENLSNYQNYEKFKKRLERFKNPINFYKFIQKSEYFKDLFIRYIPGKGVVVTTGDFDTDEEGFNYALENDYNMNLEENKPKTTNHDYKYSLISKDGVVISQSDSKQTLKNIALKSNDISIANGWIRENE